MSLLQDPKMVRFIHFKEIVPHGYDQPVSDPPRSGAVSALGAVSVSALGAFRSPQILGGDMTLFAPDKA